MKSQSKFYKWFIDWYKTKLDEVTIMISLPNELTPFKTDENSVILEVLRVENKDTNSKQYLKELLDKADEYGVKIYLNL
jgi:hypothetical protein